MLVTGLTPQSTASYTCCEGYTLIGSQSLTCLDDGTWDNNPPFCESKQAPFSKTNILASSIFMYDTITYMHTWELCVVWCEMYVQPSAKTCLPQHKCTVYHT